jgi:hypothetical protein
VTRAEAREVAAARHRSGEGKIAARGRKFDRRRLHFKGERHGGGRRGGRRVEAEREREGERGPWVRRGQHRGSASGDSVPAAVRAGGGVTRATVKGGGVGATQNGVPDRWAGTRRGPGHQRLGAARGSAVRRSARR